MAFSTASYCCGVFIPQILGVYQVTTGTTCAVQTGAADSQRPPRQWHSAAEFRNPEDPAPVGSGREVKAGERERERDTGPRAP